MYYIKPEWKQFVDRQHKGYYPILEGRVKAVELFEKQDTWRDYAMIDNGVHLMDIPCRYLTSKKPPA